MEGRSVRSVHRLMALSEYSVDQLRAIHGVARAVSVIPGGVDTQRFVPQENRAGLRAKLGLPAGPLFLTIRNLEHRMGLDALLSAWRQVRRVRRDAHLVVGGSGPLRGELERQAAQLGLGDAVTFTGFIPEDDLPLYYAAADCFVLPTRCLEGFGLVTVEALACGTPVLGTPVGGTREILEAFDPGFLFEGVGEEAIAARILERLPGILGNQPLRARARQFAEERYSWDVIIARVEALMRETAVGTGSAGRLR